MKKIICLLALCLGTTLYAQERQWTLGAGLGFFGPAFHSGFSPNLQLKADYALNRDIRLGVVTSLFHKSMPEGYHYWGHHTALRGSYYFNHLLGREGKRLDFYAGLGLGYHWLRYTAFEGSDTKVFVPVHLGLEWRFARKWQFYTEIAYNNAGAINFGFSRTL